MADSNAFDQLNAANTIVDTSPFSWPLRRKWRVTLTACFVTFIVGLNATSITSASRAINTEFGISDASFPNSFWPVTSWTVGAGLGPMIVLPILETYGVRIGYLITCALFTLFVIPQALARNFATLIATRFVAGCCGGVLQDVIDGISADVWPDAVQRSLPITIYVFSLLAGVSIGPVVGGAIINSLGWRWIFYIELILYGICFPIVAFAMRETRGHVIAKRLAKASGDQQGDSPGKSQGENISPKDFIYESVGRPTRMLCTEPVVFFFTLLSALSYGVVFISTQSVTQVYSSLYGWSEAQAGLVQIALVIGEGVAFLACIPQNAFFARSGRWNRTSRGSLNPEARLYLCVVGSFLGLTGGFFWYGWTSYRSLHWILPTIGLGIVGFGSMATMQAIMMYVTDAYAKYAASASAAVCFGENMFAAFLPLAAQSMYTNLGFQWASSLLAFVALVLSFAPIMLILRGEEIRRRSPFMQEASYD